MSGGHTTAELVVDDGDLRHVRAHDEGSILVDGDVIRHRGPGQIPTLGTDLANATRRINAQANAALVAAAPGNIRVQGQGVLAAALRLATTVDPTQPLTAIIDTTGDPDQIVNALHELPAGATLVLAAWQPHPMLTVDPYTDLHRPGVVVRAPDTSAVEQLADVTLPDPVTATFDAAVPAGSWFWFDAGV